MPQALGLEAARDVARALMGLAARGIDPLEILKNADQARRERQVEEERRRSLGLVTLGALLDRFIEFRSDPPPGSRERRIRPSTIKGWRGLATGALQPLRDSDPAALTARDVRRWHERVGAERGRVVANRGLELLSVLYAWAMREEDDVGEPLLAASPVVGVRPFREEPRDRVLDSDELAAVWQALEGETFGDALRLLLLTGARKSEVLGAEWSELDFKARLWTVPAERSKTGEARRVPLSTPAFEMLRQRHGVEPETRWIFPSPVGHVGPVRLQALLRRVQKSSGVTDWRLHDCRRVVRSGLPRSRRGRDASRAS